MNPLFFHGKLLSLLRTHLFQPNSGPTIRLFYWSSSSLCCFVHWNNIKLLREEFSVWLKLVVAKHSCLGGGQTNYLFQITINITLDSGIKLVLSENSLLLGTSHEVLAFHWHILDGSQGRGRNVSLRKPLLPGWAIHKPFPVFGLIKLSILWGWWCIK